MRARMRRRDTARHALLQEQLSCLHQRIVVKAILRHVLVQQIVECDQTHALMVRHKCAYRRAVLTLLDAFRRVIERFVKPVARQGAFVLQRAQVFNCLNRLYL